MYANMNQIGSIALRFVLSLIFIMTLREWYSSESAVNNDANELKQVIADDGMQGKTSTKIDINWMLHQNTYPVETNATKKSRSRFMLQIHNHIRKLHLKQDRLYADLNKIHLSDETEVTTKLVSAYTGLVRRQAPSQRCERHPLTVKFRDIGWVWVSSPTEFNAFACKGICSNPLIGSNITLHAIVQAELHSREPNVDNPCCVAKKLSSLDVYYYVGRERKNYTLQNMIVDECECR